MGVLTDKDVVFVNVLRSSACGHLFECIEYYYLFKSTYVPELGRTILPSIYLAYDNFTKEDLREILESKYSFSSVDIENLLEDTHIEPIDSFCSKKIHNFLGAKTTVFVEAHDLTRMSNLNMLVSSNNSVALRCAVAEDEFKNIEVRFNKFKIFQDFRVYGKRLHSFETKHHVKNVLFNKLKLYKSLAVNSAFIYISTDCRDLSKEYLSGVLEKYSNFDKVYVSVLNKDIFKDLENDKFVFLVPPIKDFHSLFDTMVYLPVGRKFDCSSRLVAECAYYNKEVIYHEIDYQDRGLDVRKFDVSTGLNNLQLNIRDPLFIEVVRQCLKQ